VAIDSAAKPACLGFIPLCEECYDFVIADDRSDRPAVRAFRELLHAAETEVALRSLGFAFVGPSRFEKIEIPSQLS
jgi:putative molybdopterin biosynthesis protein